MGALPLLGDYDLSALRRILCGGSAVPRSLSEAYRTTLGVPILHAWGMTETVADRHGREPAHAGRRARRRRSAPTPAPGRGSRCRWWSCAIVEPGTGEVLPWDDKASGEIQAAGPWIAAEYYRDESGGAQFTDDGWLRTGDVAAVDRYGSVRIVDRTKDLDEVRRRVDRLGRAGERDHGAPEGGGGGRDRRAARAVGGAAAGLRGGRAGRDAHRRGGARAPRAARARSWWLPDAVEFIDEVPKTSVGKFSKRTLREKFAGYELPEVDPAGRV